MMEPFIRELTVRVIFRVLGVPDADVERVKAGSQSRPPFQFGQPTPEQQCQLAQGMAIFWRYIEQLVASRTEESGDDFTTDLVQARDGEVSALRTQEVETSVFGLLSAGHETTTNLLGNAFRCLLSQHEIWQDVCAGAFYIPNGIEEVLRLNSSVIASRLRTTHAVYINGVTVPDDSNLSLLLGSAKRDPEVFPYLDHFDIRRSNAKEHLSSLLGVDLCLGAPLACLEARVV